MIRQDMAVTDSGIHRQGSLSAICYGRGANVTQARQVIHKMENAIANGRCDFMLDMGKTAAINEYDLYTIERIANQVRVEQGAKLKLLNPSPYIRQKLLDHQLAFTDFYQDK